MDNNWRWVRMQRENCFSADDGITEKWRCARRTDCKRTTKKVDRKEREERRKRGVVPGMGKALVASLVVCLGRHPSPSSPVSTTLFYTHSHARAVHAHNRARDLSVSLPPPSPLAFSLSLFLFRSLTPSPRGEGRWNASKNPSN